MSLPRWRRFLHFSVRRMKDYYKVLGVAKTADEGEIRQAYYKLAKRYHPDTSTEPNAEAIFQDVALAYKTLTDPLLRSRHLLEILREKHNLVTSHEEEEAVSSEFAAEVMQLNEEIENQQDTKSLERIWARLEGEVKALMEQLDNALERNNIDESQRILNRINFLNRSKRLAEKKLGMPGD